MNHEDSLFLAALATESRARTLRGEDGLDVDGMREAILDEALNLFPQVAAAFLEDSRRHERLRRTHEQRVARHVDRRFGRAFAGFRRLLAQAEVINRRQIDSLGSWMGEFTDGLPTIPGITGLYGGAFVKILLLNSLHARSITLSSEILVLLRGGHPEAAAARTRTLYEAIVTLALICLSKADTGYEVSDRSHVSAVLEDLRSLAERKSEGDQKIRRIEREARELWGTEFLQQYGWALPFLKGAKKRVSLRDLEGFIGLDIRHLYVEFNQAVHVGAENTVGRARFTRRYPFSTRPESEPYHTSRIARTSVQFLQWATEFSTIEIGHEAKAWDDALLAAVMRKDAFETMEVLREIEDADEPRVPK